MKNIGIESIQNEVQIPCGARLFLLLSYLKLRLCAQMNVSVTNVRSVVCQITLTVKFSM